MKNVVIVEVNTELLYITYVVLKYSIPKRIPEPSKKFEGEFNCLGENNEKFKNLFSYNKKEVKRIDKNGE